MSIQFKKYDVRLTLEIDTYHTPQEIKENLKRLFDFTAYKILNEIWIKKKRASK